MFIIRSEDLKLVKIASSEPLIIETDYRKLWMYSFGKEHATYWEIETDTLSTNKKLDKNKKMYIHSTDKEVILNFLLANKNGLVEFIFEKEKLILKDVLNMVEIETQNTNIKEGKVKIRDDLRWKVPKKEFINILSLSTRRRGIEKEQVVLELGDKSIKFKTETEDGFKRVFYLGLGLVSLEKKVEKTDLPINICLDSELVSRDFNSFKKIIPKDLKELIIELQINNGKAGPIVINAGRNKYIQAPLNFK